MSTVIYILSIEIDYFWITPWPFLKYMANGSHFNRHTETYDTYNSSLSWQHTHLLYTWSHHTKQCDSRSTSHYQKWYLKRDNLPMENYFQNRLTRSQQTSKHRYAYGIYVLDTQKSHKDSRDSLIPHEIDVQDELSYFDTKSHEDRGVLYHIGDIKRTED